MPRAGACPIRACRRCSVFVSVSSHRVLIVEDDAAIAAGIVRGLKKASFEVELCADGQVGLERALAGSFDALVLDLMLPTLDGFAILERIRSVTDAPVVVISAAAELPNRLQAFDLGAVDFLGKPFWVEELVARLKARLGVRRPVPSIVRLGDLTIELDARRVIRGSTEVVLQRNELDVLLYLVRHPGRALAREQIARQGLRSLDPVEGRTIDAYVARLRRKLGPAGRALVTIWGIGYRYDPEALA